MKSCFRLLILSVALSLGAATLPGCAGHKYSRDRELLERELRWLEDENYNLCDCVEEYKMRLDACRRENDALKQRGDSDVPSSSGSRTTVPSRSNQTTPPHISSPPSIELPPHTPSRTAPMISPPGEQPEGIPPGGVELILPAPSPSSRANMGEAPRFETAPLFPTHEGGTPGREVKSSTSSSDDMTSTREATSQEVDRITLNKFLTGGHNADKHPGDDGVTVHIEPRNQKGELVEVPGEVSIVVLDPALQGAEARVARWDYTIDDVVTKYQKVGLAPGFHFEPRWPNRPPTGRTFDLHVRFTTLDGRKLEASKRIDLDAVPPEEREGAELSGAAGGQWNRSTNPGRVARSSEELAPRWPTEAIPTKPIAPPASMPVESIARPIEPAPVKAPAGKPGWSPYR